MNYESSLESAFGYVVGEYVDLKQVPELIYNCELRCMSQEDKDFLRYDKNPDRLNIIYDPTNFRIVELIFG